MHSVGPRRWWIVVAALVTAEITCALENTMIYVALSHLYELYGDPIHVGWLITGFALTSAASAAICSRLGDLFGRRKVMLIMLAVAFVGSAISATGQNLNMIIAGRALQGASMAVLPLAYGILREHASERQLAVGVGVLGGTFSFGVGLGAILGGYIVDLGVWQRIFWVSAATAAIAMIAVRMFVPPSLPRRTGYRLDLVGGSMFVIPIAAILLSFSLGQSLGWDRPLPWGLLTGGLLALAVWTRHELRQANPLINVRLFAVRQITVVNLVISLSLLGPSLYPLVLLPMIQQPVWTGVGMGVTATLAGVLKLPTNLTSGSAAIAAGFVARALGMRGVVSAAAIAVLFAWIWITFAHSSLWLMMGMVILVLAPALTILYGCAPALIIEAAPPDRTSEATGLTQVLRALSMSIGAQLVSIILASSSIRGPNGARFPDDGAYMTTFAVMIGLSALTVLAAIFIPRSHTRTRRSPGAS